MGSNGSRLAGRRALVTGGGSGIGRAVVERLAAEGAAVGVVDVRPGAAEQVVAALGGATAVAATADVGDEDAVAAATREVVAGLGGLDTVVACAGVTFPGTTHETPLAAWEAMFRINCTGVFLTVKHAVPHLLDAGGGAIVTIGSVASLVAGGQSSAYDASKGAVVNLTRSVAVEYADRNIRANCVCPGYVGTDLATNSRTMTAAVATGAGRRRAGAERIDVPVSRMSDPAEIAAAVAFLCSDDASFVTGVALPVDGGYTAI